jgi:benzoate-CoA ligase
MSPETTHEVLSLGNMHNPEVEDSAMDELTLPDMLNVATAYVDANVAAGRGAKTAFCYREQQITYQDVLDQVNRTGNALRALGLEVEQRVALLLLDCPEFVYSFFGAMKIGAVAVPINTLLRPADYAYLLNDSRAKVLIVSEPLLPQIEAIRHGTQRLRQIMWSARPGRICPMSACWLKPRVLWKPRR